MSPFLRVRPVDPLNHAVPIVDKDGRPTQQFMRQWILARTVNVTTDDVAVGLDVLRDLVAAAEAALVVLQEAQAALESDVTDLEGNVVYTTREVATTGALQGGGSLAADRTLSLANSGVIPGTYGSSTHVPRITIDTYGRITGVTEEAI